MPRRASAADAAGAARYALDRVEPGRRPTSSAGTRSGRATPCPSPLMRPSCIGHRGWPGEAAMRRAAEQRLSRSRRSRPARCCASSRAFPPLTPAGHAHQALRAAGDRAERGGARRRRGGPGPPACCRSSVEQRLLAAFGGGFTPDDHDRRMEALLGNGDSQSAARTLIWAPAAKRPLFEARLALQTRAPDAYDRVAALDPALRARRRPADRPGDLAAERQPERGGAAIARRARPRSTGRSPIRRASSTPR